MRINNEEMLRRLNSKSNLADLGKILKESKSGEVKVTHEVQRHAHREGKPNIPEPIREVVGFLGELNTFHSVAKAFDISVPTVQQAVSGKVGGRPANAERARAVQERRLSIEDLALNKLMRSLDLLDDDKMEGISARDLSAVSTNMARVSQLMRENVTNFGNTTNIVVYSPERKTEDKYKVVDV